MTADARWPASGLYWSVLDASHWSRTGPLPPGLCAALDDDLPVPADSVHAIGAPFGDGRILACAADRDALAAAAGDALSLTPDALPAFAGATTLDPAALNLLVGEFEPRALRRARRSRHLAAMAATIAIAALLSIGFFRRAESWLRAEREATAAQRAELDRAGPNATVDSLAAERTRLQRTHDAAAQITPPRDASAMFASFLHAWPAAVPSRPQSIAITDTGVSLSVAIDGDAAPFLKAIAPPAGWLLDEPRLNSADNVTRLALHLRPATHRSEPTP